MGFTHVVPKSKEVYETSGSKITLAEMLEIIEYHTKNGGSQGDTLQLFIKPGQPVKVYVYPEVR